MEAINAALRKSSETKLRRRDIREGILPQVHRELGHQIHTVLGAEYPEFVQPSDEHTRFMAQSSQTNHPRCHERKEELHDPRSSHDYVQWLERNGCFIDEVFTNQQADSLEDKAGCKGIQSTSRILMKLADELVYLRPDNKSHLSYDINMRHWRMYWNELIAEMKTVHPNTSSSGVYVLTTWPYSEFLKTLALRLCDMINST